MQQFIEKYRERITGVLTGFDRLVFRGSLRRLNYGRWDESLGAVVAKGMEQYLWQNQILFKDYQQHVKRWSERVKDASLRPFRQGELPHKRSHKGGSWCFCGASTLACSLDTRVEGGFGPFRRRRDESRRGRLKSAPRFAPESSLSKRLWGEPRPP